MSDLFKRIDLSAIYPPLRAKVVELAENCRKRGVDYWAISGYRSPEEQAKLYFQGRTLPGPKVTNAKPFTSYHNYGLAVDFCKDSDKKRDGLQPDWDVKEYAVLAEEAKKIGLEAGYYWLSFKDPPHVGLFITQHKIKLFQLEELYKKGGIPAVWAHLDKFKW